MSGGGRFCGCGTAKPRRSRKRQIVEVASTLATAVSRAKCSAMLATPKSKPPLYNVLHSRTFLPSTSAGTTCGLVWSGASGV